MSRSTSWVNLNVAVKDNVPRRRSRRGRDVHARLDRAMPFVSGVASRPTFRVDVQAEVIIRHVAITLV
jgi:hypothetical protein